VKIVSYVVAGLVAGALAAPALALTTPVATTLDASSVSVAQYVSVALATYDPVCRWLDYARWYDDVANDDDWSIVYECESLLVR
jgi:hypothetical protein